MRGLKPDEFSPEDNVLVFLGISCYIGVQRGRQDEEGNMLSTFDRFVFIGSRLTRSSAHPRREAFQDAATRQADKVLITGICASP